MNELQSTNETHVFIKIYLTHFILERSTRFVVSLRDRWKNIYSERGHLAPFLLPEARGCQRLHPLTSRIVRDASDRLRIPGSTLDSDWTDYLNISPRGSHITWSLSGYTPARLAYPDALSSPCSLIKTWQLVKADGVTRNEPQIHVNSHYITQLK